MELKTHPLTIGNSTQVVVILIVLTMSLFIKKIVRYYGYWIPLTLWEVAVSLDVNRGSDTTSRWQKRSRRYLCAAEMMV